MITGDPPLRSIRELIDTTAPFTREDPVRSWRAVAMTAVLMVASLAMAAAGIVPLPLRLCASVCAALLIVRMFVLYHDYEHGAILRHSTAGRRLLSLFGLFVLSPPSIWNRLHNYHHSHNSQLATSGVGSFPVMTVSEYRSAPALARLRYRILRSPWMMVMAYFTIFLAAFCVKPIHDEARRHRDSIWSLALHVALIAFYLQFGWVTLLLGLVGPLWLAHVVGTYLFYAQHNFPGVRLKPREDWNYVYAAIYSSSFMDGGRLMHWFTANIGYHHVHHLNSRIPFYRLPEAMDAVPELQRVSRTSLRIRDIWACLRLKLWDPALSTMVGYPSD